MPTIYLYTVEEQVVQQIGSVGLPATLQLRVSPDADIQLYDVLEGSNDTFETIKALDIKLQSVTDDTPVNPDPIIPSTVIYLFAGEVPQILTIQTPLAPATLKLRAEPSQVFGEAGSPETPATLQLNVSPDTDIPLYPVIEGNKSTLTPFNSLDIILDEVLDQLPETLQLLTAVDIFVRPYDYFITGNTVTLTVQKAFVALTTDGIILVQQHTLIVQKATIALTTDGITLVQNYTLEVQESFIVLSIDDITLVQNYILAVQEATIPLAADNITLPSDINLIVAYAIIRLISGNVELGPGLPIISLDGRVSGTCAELEGAVNGIEFSGNIFNIK